MSDPAGELGNGGFRETVLTSTANFGALVLLVVPSMGISSAKGDIGLNHQLRHKSSGLHQYFAFSWERLAFQHMCSKFEKHVKQLRSLSSFCTCQCNKPKVNT